MKKDSRSMMFAEVEKGDINLWRGVGKALQKGGWVFPGGVKVTNRARAHKIAARLNTMIMRMEREAAARG